MRVALGFFAVGIALSFVGAVNAACPASDGDSDGGDVPCENPLDCELGESCIDGACTDGREGEGEGEGEREVDQDGVIAAVCTRLTACQGTEPTSCINDLQRQIDEMRGRGSDVCQRAAEATLQFLSCINGLACEQMQGDVFGFCPVGNEARALQSECFNGSGEGEGEKECFSDDDCARPAFCFDGKCVQE